MGTWLSDKYAEGTIGHRFYAGCQNIDTVEQVAADHARALFGAPHAYVQPHSGIDANLVAFWAILAQRVESPALAEAGRQARQRPDRGRLGDAAPASSATSARSACRWTPAATSPTASGRTSAARCSTSPPTAPIRRPSCSTTTRCAAPAREFKPLVLIAGYSAYPRQINFAKMREIADEVGATLMVDMAHFAGLVAGKVFTGDYDPVPHAHVTTTTTHKSLRGPRGGLVLCQPEYADSVDRGCPMVLGGPLGHVMAAKAVALAEARQPAFRTTRRRSPTTPSRWPTGLTRRGARLVTGGTDNHLVLHRRVRLRADRPPGRVGAARLRHRHQPQRDPARPERRLVHLRRPDRHPGADHPRLRRRRVRPGRRADRRRADRHHAGRGLDRRRRPRRSTRSPTASPTRTHAAAAELLDANPLYPGLELVALGSS